MTNASRLGAGCATLLLTTFAVAASADDTLTARPQVGEIREIAVTGENLTALKHELHSQGWLEADGRILEIALFETLYQHIGRAFTPAGVDRGLFAVPRLRSVNYQPVSSDDPYGVLSRNVTPNRLDPTPPAKVPKLSFWIFIGQNIETANASASAPDSAGN